MSDACGSRYSSAGIFFWQRRSQECVLWKLVRRYVAAAVIKLRAGVNSGAVHEARREEEAELELTFFCA